jgi:hypothetical protein
VDDLLACVPSVRGVAGYALMGNCLARRTPAAALLGMAGFGLFARSWTNLELNRLTGLGGDRGGSSANFGGAWQR